MKNITLGTLSKFKEYHLKQDYKHLIKDIDDVFEHVYIQYFNSCMTVKKFAEYFFDIPIREAYAIISVGRIIHYKKHEKDGKRITR